MDRSETRIRWWTVLLGFVAVAASNFLACYSAYIVHSSRLVFGHIEMAAMIVFMFLVLPIALVLRFAAPRYAMNAAELIVIFSMNWIGATIPAANFAGMFLGTIASPYYYASAENQWVVYFHAHLPRWALPSNEGGAIQWFFEGKPPEASIPWEVWIGPLIWWSTFLVALAWAGICLVSILRKQWVDRERLPFPIAEIPLTYAAEGGTSRWPVFARQKLFWIGVAIPSLVIGWNIVGYFIPTFPQIPIGQFIRIRLARSFPSIPAKINFFLLGVAFFTNLDVLFSVWFFYLLYIVESGIFNRTGFTIGSSDMWGSSGGAAMGWQSFGAFAAFVIYGLWMARPHLYSAFAKAFGNHPEIDDRDELLSYRWAVFGLIGSIGYMLAWLCQSGMSALVAGAFLATMVVMFIGVTRIVSEAGLVYLRAPITPQSFVFYTVGMTNMAPASATSLALSYAHFGLGNTFGMSALAHIAKLAADVRVNKRKILWATCLALASAFCVCTVVILYLGYKHGAYNFGVYTFRIGNRVMFLNLVSKMRNPFPTDWPRIAFFGIGAAAVGVLGLLRYRFPWWPLHPLGLTVCSARVIHIASASIFLAWLAKTVILRIGGMTAYNRAKPFFLGLLSGYVLGVGVSFLVDVMFFFGDGHMVHRW